jgi:predicted RNA binding protein YcfA (HicA-like mRNA interferase family)
MEKLPPLSGRQVVKALSKASFEIVGRKGVITQTEKENTNKNIWVIVHFLLERSPYNAASESIYQ